MDRVKAAQGTDPRLLRIGEQVVLGLHDDMVIHEDGSFHFGSRICIPDGEVRAELLAEAHSSPYSIHPGGTKIYRDLQMNFWQHKMKRSVARSVATCQVCQQVKAEHQRVAGLLRPLPIPEWKWQHVTIDFVTGLPQSTQGSDTVWVIVDRLTKFAHFIPFRLGQTT